MAAANAVRNSIEASGDRAGVALTCQQSAKFNASMAHCHVLRVGQSLSLGARNFTHQRRTSCRRKEAGFLGMSVLHSGGGSSLRLTSWVGRGADCERSGVVRNCICCAENRTVLSRGLLRQDFNRDAAGGVNRNRFSSLGTAAIGTHESKVALASDIEDQTSDGALDWIRTVRLETALSLAEATERLHNAIQLLGKSRSAAEQTKPSAMGVLRYEVRLVCPCLVASLYLRKLVCRQILN